MSSVTRNVLFACVLAASSACRETGAAETIPGPVTLYFTSDVRGQTQPVGCSAGYYGGLGRRAAYLGSEHRPGETLLIDAGDVLPSRVSAAIADGHMQALAQMHYDAVAVGDAELRYGFEATRELAARYEIPLVATNLVRADSGEPAVEPMRVWEREGVRVGLLAVLDPSVVKATAPMSWRVTDPYASTRSALAELRRRDTDIVVVIAHGDDGFQYAMAQAFPEVDFIVSSHTPGLLDSPLLVGSTPIGRVGHDGSHVGRVTFAQAGAEGPFAVETTEPMRRAVDDQREQDRAAVRAQLANAYARRDEYGDRGGIAARIVELEERKRRLEGEVAAAGSPSAEGKLLRYELVAMDVSLPEDPRIAALVAVRVAP